MFKLWWRAFLPGWPVDKAVTTYEALLREAPPPTWGQALREVALGGFLGAALQAVLNFLLSLWGDGPTGEQLVSGLCGLLVFPFFNVIGFALGTFVFLLIAVALGGQGDMLPQAYFLALVCAPASILQAGLSVMAGPVGDWLLGALGLYVGWRIVLVFKAVHRYSWGRAWLTLLIPPLLFSGAVLGFSVLFGAIEIKLAP